MILCAEFEPLQLDVPQDLVGLDNRDALKEWIWTNFKDQILSSMKMHQDCAQSQLVRTRRRLALLDSIDHVQRQYLQMEDQTVVFGCLLDSLLELMNSQYGFIGEILKDENGNEFLHIHAFTHSALKFGSKEFQKYVHAHMKLMDFRNLDSLFGNVITKKAPVIANDPPSDPRSSGAMPKGHPPLKSFLGLPFFYKGKMNGMVGIANKPGGYTEEDVKFLEPFQATCSNLIQAYRQSQENSNLINKLEERVAERMVELQRANQELERANKKVLRASAAQLQHFACMSHEIRTPLNCILGLSSLLQETELSRLQEDSLRMIISSGDLLLAVVNDVLDYSKLESDNVDFKISRSKLQETLNAVVPAIETKGQPKNLVLNTFLDPRLPDCIHTDARRLQQILYNILGNAIKFSPEGGQVDFSVKVCDNCPEPSSLPSPESKEDEKPDYSGSSTTTIRPTIQFVVKDYGPGIKTEDFGKIFQPFKQASIETEKLHGGTGLGLAISRKLAKCLGGKISVESEMGEWTCFTAEFPLREPLSEVKLHASKLENATVLLVESDSKVLSRMELLFQTCGIDFLSFQDMQSILDASEEFRAKQREGADSHACVCLANEQCFEAGAYKTLADSVDKMILLSYGPKYCVKESQYHYRGIHQMVPAVLVQSIASFIENSNSLPGVPPPPATPLVPSHCPVAFTQYRILIAEDNLVNQKVLRSLLRRLGLPDGNVCIANNGKEAVEMESKHDFDIIFMDLQMPIMDGFEACNQIASRYNVLPSDCEGTRRRSGMPSIIILTASIPNSFGQLAEIGADKLVPKPFKLRQLKECLVEISASKALRTTQVC